MIIESAVLEVGHSAATLVARKWMSWRRERRESTADLTELMRFGFRDQLLRRRTTRQFEALADSVYERLLPLIGQEFRGLDDGTREAVLGQVARVLDGADLSDGALLRDDMDPVKVARRIRKTFPPHRAEAEFGAAGGRLYEVLLDECCDCLAHILIHLPEFTERAAAESLARLSDTINALDAILARLPARTLDAPDGESLDEEFSRRYLGAVIDTLDRLELHGVGFERFKRPRTTLSVAYISLNVTDEGIGRDLGAGDPLRVGEWRSRQREPDTVRVERALGERPWMLIRGEAGGGKTTLLRWLAVTAARGAFTRELAPLNGCVPFLIKLRSHVGPGRPMPRPEEFLDDVTPGLSGLMPKAWVHRRLTSGRALLLVDGIDEITEARRAEARSWLSGLTSQFPGIRVVVTSRPAAAEANWLGAEGFGTAFLEHLGAADLYAFVQNWHKAVRDYDGLPCAPEELPAYEAKLLARMASSPHLRTLATTPLLAAMLCALNLDRKDALPRNRMSLYASAVSLLTDTRDAGRRVPSALSVPLESGEKLILLQDLAWYLQSNDTLEMPRLTARQLVSERLATMPQVQASPDAVLGALLERSGVLQQPVKDHVGFVHRTLQEYLAARRAADLGDMALLVGKAHRQQWRETVLMTAGCANEPLRESLITGIAGRARAEREHATRLRRLIVSCWETLPAISSSVRAIIDECVASLIPPNDFGEARALATAGKEVLARLPPTLDWLSESQAACCVRTAWLVNGPEALDLLGQYAADQRPAVEVEISRAWDYFDSGEYAERVLSARPPGGGLYLTDSEAHLAALGTAAPLARLQVTLPSPADFRFLTRHAESLRALLVNIRDPGAQLSGLPQFPQLSELSFGAPGLRDLSFLNSLPQLRRIWLTACEDIDDYSPLARFTALSALSLVGCGRLQNLSQLPPLDSIRSLSLVGADLEPGALDGLVKAAPGLAHLALKECDWVTGLEPLSALPLEDLRVPGISAISDLRPLAGQPRLRALDVRDTGVRDLAPLAALPNLQRLWISGIAPGADLSPLARNQNVRIYIGERQHIRGGETFGGRLQIQALPRNQTLSCYIFVDLQRQGLGCTGVDREN